MNKRLNCLAVAILSLLLASSQKSPGSVTAQLQVQVPVPSSLSYKILKETSVIAIKAKDIEKGYKDVTTGTVLAVTTNSINGYALSIYCQNGNFFRSVLVTVENESYVVSPDGEVDVFRPYNGPQSDVTRVSYRFYLSFEAKAIDYPWPISITVHAL